MSTLPEGTATFLFTDIEGSTRLWERAPEAMREALARHDALLREAVEAHRGHVFKTIGDAFCAVFAAAPDALVAALAAQRELAGMVVRAASEVSGTAAEEMGLRVRMAVHAGTAQARDGDYFGPTLNRIARLLAVGHGGQVLLSQAACDLLGDALPSQAGLRDLGSHRLKDLQQPEHIYQLLHPDLPADFPPLRSLSPETTNLPVQLTSFIGREKEMEEIKRLLSRTRLLTLTGSGGCGKTRLAAQVGADLLADFADGVWLVELAAIADPALVPQTVASTLGIREEPGQRLLETLQQHLKPKSLLLLLDNCEHLSAACAQLAETLLQACPNLRILASSREALGIAGELAYRVPSLSLPELPRLPSAEAALVPALARCEATRLFVERAALSYPGFALTEQNAPAVAQVCVRLDGIPLAIELAAARIKVLSADQIAARLDDRFRLLTGGSRTALPRQQTLRALIDWSYDLLSEAERTLLRRLSVFVGGWTLEAAEAICADSSPSTPGAAPTPGSIALTPNPSPTLWERGEAPTPSSPPPTTGEGRAEAGSPPSLSRSDIPGKGAGGLGQEGQGVSLEAWEVLDLLSRLVDKSLVMMEEPDGNRRYRLLETVRQYSQDKLLASGEATEIRNRHREWYLAWAEQAESQLQSPQEAVWLERLEAEDDNLRAALQWSHADENGAERELRLVKALWYFWYRRGYLSEGRERLAGALARSEGLSEELRAKALHAAGTLAWCQGDFTPAVAQCEESLALFRQQGDLMGIARSLTILGNVATYQGDYPRAIRFLEEALALYRQLDKRTHIATMLHNLAVVAQFQSDYRRAAALLEECLSLKRALGDKHGAALSLAILGHIMHGQGDSERGRALCEEGLAIFRELENRQQIALCRVILAHIVGDNGDLERAAAWSEEGLRLFEALGDRWGEALALSFLAETALRQGQEERALASCRRSLALCEALGDRRGRSWSLFTLARLAHRQGDLAQARRHLAESLDLAQQLGDRHSIARCLESLAALVHAQEQANRAAQLYAVAEALRAEIGCPVPAFERPGYDQEIASLRSHLGEAEFAAVWSAGSALSPEQTIAEALSESA